MGTNLLMFPTKCRNNNKRWKRQLNVVNIIKLGQIDLHNPRKNGSSYGPDKFECILVMIVNNVIH